MADDSILAQQVHNMELQLSQKLLKLDYGPTVEYRYNPVEYAGAPHSKYLSMFCSGHRPLMILGMNPGPWGMSQTGVSELPH